MLKFLNTTPKKVIAGILAALIIGLLIFLGVKFGLGNTPGAGFAPKESPSSTPVNEEIAGRTFEEANGDEQMPEITLDKQLYQNNKVLTAESNGGYMTVGIDENSYEINGTALVLAPTYTDSTGHNFGFFISTERQDRIVNSNQDYISLREDGTTDLTNLFIDETYDKLISTAYNGQSDYGLVWRVTDDYMTLISDKIKIIVIDLVNHNLRGSFTVEISKNDSGSYEISDMYNADVGVINPEKLRALWDTLNSDGNFGYNPEIYDDSRIIYPYDEMDFVALRSRLVDEAINTIMSWEYISVDEPFDTNSAIVELTDVSYHLKYLTRAHELGYRGNMEPLVWAVTINSSLPEIGHYTFYFAPESIECVGCDFFYRNDETTYNSFI